MELADRLRELTRAPRATQLAAMRAMSQPELEEADDIMSSWRIDYGHMETPHRSGDPALSVCDQCGPLGDEERIAAPVFHPGNIGSRA